MRLLIIISILLIGIVSCSRVQEEPVDEVSYSYSVEGWESLGKETLVTLDARNASAKEQVITFTVDVINSEGRVFSKDTTIHFEKSERAKNFQLTVETEGEIKEVKVKAIQ